MSENKAFKKAGIRNLVTRNYELSKSIIDIEGLLDPKLSMSENWFNIFKPRILKVMPWEKRIQGIKKK